MGVDISHIIRHDFRNVQDKNESLEFTKKTIEQLKNNLCIHSVDDKFCIYQDEEWGEGQVETKFELPIYDVEFILHNGFWQIESNYHYFQIVMHEGDYFWLRQLTFDIAKALEQNEAWYAEEFYTWNGVGCDKPETTFEQWLEYAVNKYGKSIPEYNQSAIIAQDNLSFPDYEPIYHDSFKECKELFDKLQDRLKEYKLLGLDRTGDGYLRCEKDGDLFLIHANTLKPMFNEPIESMLQSLNGPEFIVRKQGLSAVFDKEGQQLTDFVKGDFDWKWAPFNPLKDKDELRIIFNEEAGIELKPR